MMTRGPPRPGAGWHFADAAFDGRAELGGVRAVRVDTLGRSPALWSGARRFRFTWTHWGRCWPALATSWDALGAVITEGASLPRAGEPRAIAGHAHDRYVYAPVDGILRTSAQIGDAIRRGEEVARVGDAAPLAPLDGVLRGLTHDDVRVAAGTKVVEVDPRGRVDEVRGISEIPRRIAEGVLLAIRAWERRLHPSDRLPDH